MLQLIQHLGHRALNYFATVGHATLLLLAVIIGRMRFKLGFKLLVEQLYAVGVLSLPIIICAGVFVGMVLGLQGYTTLVRFGAEQAIGELIALSLVRELGPVIGALLFAGRAGSALTAEIGLMKATEQLDGLQLMGIDPLRRIIAPRFWAGIISMPLLSLIFCAVAVMGGYLVSVEWLNVDDGAFWSNMQASVDFHEDILNGVIKSIVFGFLIIWIAVYQGYASVPTSEGIGYATTRTVVYSSLIILGADFVLTAVMFGGLA